jgi:predicted kinase
MEAVLFIGPQAAGKSTFYKQRFADTHIRLNLDMLRTRHRLHILLRACLEAKQPLVLDNTNTTVAEREYYISLARAARFGVTGYYFIASLAECLQRNAARPERERIPAKGIAGTFKRLEPPSLAEGFDTLSAVRVAPGGGFSVGPWSGPDATGTPAGPPIVPRSPAR